MPVIDLEKISTQRLYTDVVDAIHNEPITGKNIADKVMFLYTYWKKNHNKTTAQLIGEDIIDVVTEIINKRENEAATTPNGRRGVSTSTSVRSS